MKRYLLLFDIDGTLITSGGAGEQAFRDAMETFLGVRDDLSGITIAGATDRGLAHLLLQKHGIPDTSENVAALLNSYLNHLQTRISLHQGRVLPGIFELLDRLHARPDCTLALLTGNLERGAQIKLQHYGVWHYFEFGAFADHHPDRNELAHLACSHAAKHHGEAPVRENIYVLGDTPRDIDCGKAIGAKTVAIATGIYSVKELTAYAPDFLFEDLSCVDDVLATLGLTQP